MEKLINYYAHSKEGLSESEWQTLVDHLRNTAWLAQQFGKDAGVSDWAYLAGYFHDLGKFSNEFQARLRGKKLKVDHSTAGAKELLQVLKDTPYEPIGRLLSYCITGHHAGLLNYGDPSDLPGDGTLVARLKTDICDYKAYKEHLELDLSRLSLKIHIRPQKNNLGFSLAFWTRMIYSALVDADFQETQEYMLGKQARGEYDSIQMLCEKLNEYLKRFEQPKNAIDQRRTETLRACIQKSLSTPGFFKLTVPTGGGKTLASLAFALNHAVHNNLKRIIYIIPYTTIIEQNAQIFKDIFGEQNVLEHHCHFDWETMRNKYLDDDQTSSVYKKLKLAAENWDIPIVVTTNVQFFESLFANRSSRCRKIHNLAKSVMIFDEAQMLPREYMKPAMAAIWELVINYGASVVFCTATQPNLERFLPEPVEIIELADDPSELFHFYRRVNVVNLGTLTDEELIGNIQNCEQVLCIVNTRHHASGLYRLLPGNGNYHLSTLMCPAHRKEKLSEIRLQLESGKFCRVISTTVMEAGVDLDFPVGYRALSGLDSINQAAGRVNRNMRWNQSELYVFEPKSEFIKRTPPYIVQCIEISRQILRNYQEQPISIPAVAAYFERLYSLQDPDLFEQGNFALF